MISLILYFTMQLQISDIANDSNQAVSDATEVGSLGRPPVRLPPKEVKTDK